MLRVKEQSCELVVAGKLSVAGYVTTFPSPRTERVSPGHLVAVLTTSDGTEAVVWRWYDAVVVGEEAGMVRLWEPAHGEVLAAPRGTGRLWQPGMRAYLSSGLPGSDWWVAGPRVNRAEDAEVELDEVERFCRERGVWREM